MTDFLCMTSIPIMKNTIWIMAGIIRTEVMTTGAGTAVRKEKQTILKYAGFGDG